jgi:predicted dinucleotide-binding enzyme
LSHMGYHHLFDEAKHKGKPGRKAIAIAADSDEDSKVVAEFIDSLGFDPLVLGKLSNGKLLEPGQRAFGANVDSKQLAAYLQTNQDS